MCKSEPVSSPVAAVSMMGCNCTCNGCDFYEAAEKQENLINVTSLSDHENLGASEFCSKDRWGNKYQLACRSYVDDLRNCCGGPDDASSSIIVVLSIACLVLLFVIAFLIKRKNKEIASLKSSLNIQKGEKKDNVEK
jgi:hypothetical protein